MQPGIRPGHEPAWQGHKGRTSGKVFELDPPPKAAGRQPDVRMLASG